MEAKWRQAQLPSARPEAIPTPAQEREEQGQPCSSEGLNGLLGFSNRWFIFPQSAGEPCSKRLEDLSIPHLLSRCQDPSLRSFQQRIILPWAPGAIRLTASPPRLEAFQRRARPPRSPPRHHRGEHRASIPHWGLQRLLPRPPLLARSGESPGF